MTDFHAIIDVRYSEDAPSRVLAMAEAAQAICETAGKDPADCVLMLLTAAAYITRNYLVVSPKETEDTLVDCLAEAVVIEKDFFHSEDKPIQ